jgi:hypothetical protein
VRLKEIYLVLVGLIVFLLMLGFYNFTFAESFIVGYQVYIFLRFVNNIGYTIGFFDFLCFYSALDTLLMPLIGYRIFNTGNQMVLLWGWYMRVPEADYYNFLIPANLALFLSVNFLIRKYKTVDYKAMIEKLREHVKDKAKIGIVLTVVGFLSSFLINTNTPFTFVFYLLSMLKYVGPLYIYFSNAPFKKNVFLISVLVFLAQSIYQGMFGEFVMYVSLVIFIVALRFRLGFFTKLSIFIVGLFLVTVLQSFKSTYRAITWKGTAQEGLSLESSSHVEIFSSLFYNRLTDMNKLFNERSLFLIYVRMNQGYLISRAMDYVPRVEPFAQGTTIARSVAAIIVPRFLWPDKPEAGGRENLSRFLGIKQRLRYSMNIGPYGEAYGNFGPGLGIAFIVLYGLFLSYLFKALLVKCQRNPSLLIWFPLLFFSTLTVETDIMSTLNFFIKGALFVYILYWGARKFFGVSL